MTRQDAVRRLFLIWMAMMLPASLIVAAQTIAGKYGEDSDVAWAWLMSQTVPALSLLLAAVFSEVRSRWRTAPTNRFRWRCALWGSLLQGLGVYVILLIEPLVSATSYQLFSSSVPALTLLQGACVAAIGSVVFDGR